jgi:hypothetical protein
MAARVPPPSVTLGVGDVLAVVVENPNVDVTEPTALDTRLICRATVTGPGRHRTATFVALRRGSTRLTATTTGVPAGTGHPAYLVDVLVR